MLGEDEAQGVAVRRMVGKEKMAGGEKKRELTGQESFI